MRYNNSEAKLTHFWKMLVKLYHLDRFANEPDKLETYSKLTTAIYLARDTGDGNIFDQGVGDNDPNEIGAYLIWFRLA